jgi:hypothetical protein
MGIKQEDISRAIAAGNKVLAQLRKVCPKPGEPKYEKLVFQGPPYSIPLPKPKSEKRICPLHEHHSDPQLQSPKPQRDQAPALGAAVPGKTKGIQRVIVRFIGFRCHPLDPDNFAGGCKDLLDGLRHAKLIPGDEPDRIIFVTEQRKVAHRKDERTEIELLS